MSTTYAAREVIYGRLQEMGGGVPIHSAFKSASRVVPRYEVQPATEINPQFTLAGDTMHTAEIAITVVVSADTGEGDFGPLVVAIQSHFPAGDNIDGISIMGMPTPRMPPFLDDGELRLPVIVRYRALLTV